MKKFIAILFVIACIIVPIGAMPIKAEAGTVYRYTTPVRVKLKTKIRNGQTKYVVKMGTQLTVTKEFRKWVRVKYKGKRLYCRKKWLSSVAAPRIYSGQYLRNAGVIHWNGYKFTWYSQRILPGYGLKIPGRHVDGQGFVCDKQEYIVLGSNTANRGKVIPTPFGKFGKVYDAGYVTTNWFDCYTNF